MREDRAGERGDNKCVTLIQNAEKARMERRAKMMWRNGGKKSENYCKSPKGEKVSKHRSRQVPRASSLDSC